MVASFKIEEHTPHPLHQVAKRVLSLYQEEVHPTNNNPNKKNPAALGLLLAASHRDSSISPHSAPLSTASCFLCVLM
jgi:hypothetical protein